MEGTIVWRADGAGGAGRSSRPEDTSGETESETRNNYYSRAYVTWMQYRVYTILIYIYMYSVSTRNIFFFFKNMQL